MDFDGSGAVTDLLSFGGTWRILHVLYEVICNGPLNAPYLSVSESRWKWRRIGKQQDHDDADSEDCQDRNEQLIHGDAEDDTPLTSVIL